MLTYLLCIIFGICRCRNNNKNLYELVLNNYKPERKVLDAASLKFILNKISNFIDSSKTYMSHKVFKTIEFFTAEVIIRNSIFISNTSDTYLKNIAQDKIYNVIKLYMEIFNENKSELIESLKFKTYQNVIRINNDIYSTFKIINRQFCKNLKSDYDPEVTMLDKNFYWYPGIKYNMNKLEYFVEFFKKNRTI